MDLGKKMKSDNALSEDGQRDYESGVQDLTNKNVSEIDSLTEAKEKEVMTV